MANESKKSADYNADLIICVDAATDMGPIFKDIKAGAPSFYRKLFAKNPPINMPDKADGLCVKVIVFRNYSSDTEPMLESPFFYLGKDGEYRQFDEFVKGIEVTGGKTAPKITLEDIPIIMQSDITRVGAKRDVLWLFSNTTIGWLHKQIELITDRLQ